MTALAAAVLLAVSPAHALVDAPVNVHVRGVPAHAQVVLAASTVDSRGRHWRSRVAYRANAHGVVDTHGDMRLFTSMTTPAGHVLLWFQPGPAPIRISADVAGRQVARVTFMRRGRAPGVREHDTTLRHDGFLAKFFAPAPGAPKHPAVLLLGGSGGGYADPDMAALLASHGYPTLALAYFGVPGLPATLGDIRLEYFREALYWLAGRPGVDPYKIVVIGASRGAEAAILTGAAFPSLVGAVVAWSGSSSVLGGVSGGNAWTLNGQPIVGELPVERVAGPVLLFAGGEDAVIGSNARRSFDRLRQRARQHGRADVTGVFYPRAGHGVVGIPDVPAPGEIKALKGYYEFGGEPAANAAANADSWQRILRLLTRL